MLLLLAGLLATAAARAQPVGAPTLNWRSADGRWSAAASQSLALRYEVSGLLAEAVVTQTFRNDSEVFLEGQYVLPLPADAAVHTLRLRIGSRVIEGEIREREQARAEYRAAAAAGKRTSLVEQHDGNLFRTAVANVAPGETVEVEVGFWQRVAYQDGRFTLAAPLTFVPRYEQNAGGTPVAAGNEPARAPAAALLVASPRVSVQVHLEPGLPVRTIESGSHAIEVVKDGTGYSIALTERQVPADRDFVLTWRPEPGAAPNAALFVEHTPDADYALVMLLAPEQTGQRLPRELVLVIDTSGSMYGESLEQAKATLDAALARLAPPDRFSVIQFNSTTEALFEHPVEAQPQAVAVAREWVSLLEANGGTEMLPALTAALDGTAPQGYVRQIVFATDGAVTGAEALYSLIEQRIGGSRLFPVGIGDAPNGAFMHQAARMGRGASVVVRDVAEVALRMQELFAKLDRPALRDVSLGWPGAADAYPAQVPDLYAGEPLLVVARLDRAAGDLTAAGWLRDAAWAKSLPLERTRSDAGVARLWARARIDELEDQLRRGADEASVRPQVIEVALAHRLVTRYTSLVAVDRTPVRPADAPLQSVQVANGATESLAFAQGATAAPLWFALGLAGLLLMALARRRPAGSGAFR